MLNVAMRRMKTEDTLLTTTASSHKYCQILDLVGMRLLVDADAHGIIL